MVNLSALDLNLFLVLHAVLEEGSTVRAARRLRVTQSAVSNALARLRHALGDPLFVRSGRGLAPTPRAEALRPAVAEALRKLEGTLSAGFDARSTERTFTIACADHHQAADMPRVARAFAAAMPRACLRLVSVDYLLSTDGLAQGTVDLVLAPEGSSGPGTHAAPLFSESASLLVRPEHPHAGRSASLAQLSALGHIDVHLALGRPGEVNRAVQGELRRVGFERRVALVVPSFTAAAMAAAQTDYVAWLPSHAARLFEKLLGLRALRTPLPSLELGCQLQWHERTHADPGVRLLRQLVESELGAPPSVARARRPRPRRNSPAPGARPGRKRDSQAKS